MSKTKFVDFKAVKAAITMQQVLEHYGLLDKFKRSGDRLSGACPIHKGSNATQFSVSIEKNVWNCFSECKHGGNVLDFIARMEDVSIHAAANKAIEWFHLDPEAMSADSNQEPVETARLGMHPTEASRKAPSSREWRTQQAVEVSPWTSCSGNIRISSPSADLPSKPSWILAQASVTKARWRGASPFRSTTSRVK